MPTSKLTQKPHQPKRPLDVEDEVEWLRLQDLTKYEQEARLQGFQRIAGLDEAGRGPLAGPVVAAVCILPFDVYIPYVNDSKQLQPKLRQKIFSQLISDSRIHYGVGIVEPREIDQINIFQATIRAMFLALEALVIPPDCLLVDGLKLPHPTIPATKIIKGDTLSQSIAAASIIAKETRDHIMKGYHERWPHYGFGQHKGYGTAMHHEAIEKYGPCEIHRLSFEPFKTSLNQRCESTVFTPVAEGV